MSLRNALGKAVNSAFAATGDIPEAITLTVNAGGTYNPVTGASQTTAAYNVNAIVIVPTAEDLSESGIVTVADGVEGEYSTFLINRADLVSAGFTDKIEVGDIITYQGNPYTVKKPADIFGLLFKVIGLRGSDGT
jgi:hypothetical protein